MKLEALKGNLESLVKQRKASNILIILLVLTNFILVSALVFKEERTIIIPSSLTKTVWLSDSMVSKEYLEEVGIFLASLMLDVTADSATYKREVVLRHVSSGYHNELNKALIEDQQRMLKEQYSTSFKPVEAQISNRDLVVIMTGDLTTYVGSKKVKQERLIYKMNFEYKLGNLLLKSFKSESKR